MSYIYIYIYIFRVWKIDSTEQMNQTFVCLIITKFSNPKKIKKKKIELKKKDKSWKVYINLGDCSLTLLDKSTIFIPFVEKVVIWLSLN